MTNEEVKAAVKEALQEMGITPDTLTKRYVHHQDGVAELFGCSLATASRILASGEIDEAVSKIGRCIVVDIEKALELTKVSKKNILGS